MRASVTFGSFEFDPSSRLLKRDGVELQLPPRVLGVLEVLLRSAGDVVPRQELIDHVWKDAFVTDTSLAEAVSLLRQALGDDPQSPSFIQTFHRRGYRFVAPVAVKSSPPGGAAGVAVASPVAAPDNAAVRPSIGMQLVPWSVAVACALLAGVAVWQAVTRRETPLRPVTRFAVAPPNGMRFDSRAPAFALSPDGSRLVFSACDVEGCALFVRRSDRLEASPVAGTADAAAPFFSPDGRWVGFFADGHLKKVSVNGGAAVTLADASDALGGAWTPAGDIIYAGGALGLRLVAESGGKPVALTSPNQSAGEVRHIHPSLVPGGRFLLFTISTSPELVHGRIARLELNTRSRPPVVLLANAVSAIAPATDVLAFAAGSELQVVGADFERGQIVGAPQSALTNLAVVNVAPQFGASHDGTAIVLTAEATPPPALLWSGTTIVVEGNRSKVVEEPVSFDDLRSVAVSPEGRRVAGFSREPGARAYLWI
jgi:serine/threonine-protein kinase